MCIRDRVSQGEPVAVIGSGYQLLWASGEPLTDTVKRTGIKVGSVLYANAAPAPVLTAAQRNADELVAVVEDFASEFGPCRMTDAARAVLAKIEAAGQEGGKE